MWLLVYVVLSTFLANASSDAMLHRIFLLLVLSGEGNSTYAHTCVSISLS